MSFSSCGSFLDRVVVGGLRVHEDGRDFGSVMADLWEVGSRCRFNTNVSDC